MKNNPVLCCVCHKNYGNCYITPKVFLCTECWKWHAYFRNSICKRFGMVKRKIVIRYE